jgi:hypothetical protein
MPHIYKLTDHLSPQYQLQHFFVRLINGRRVFDQLSWDYFGCLPVDKQKLYTERLKTLAGHLERFNSKLGRRVVPNRGYSCPVANAQAGGGEKSEHLLATAVDFDCSAREQKTLDLDNWPGGYGKANTWCHIDTRPKRARWTYP